MVAQVAASRTPDDELSMDDSEADFDARANPFEPVRPATAQLHQLLALVPPLTETSTLLGGLAAVALGGGVGLWLARRRDARPVQTVRRTASRVEAAAGLAPLAIRLLSNPVVRAFALRMVMRQISRRIGL